MSSDYGIPTAPVKSLDSPWRFFQFNLRTLLIGVTLVAVILGCFVAAPLFAILACIAYVGVSCLLLSALLYGKGWIKGFSIGFTVPHVLGYLVALGSFARPEGVLLLFVIANTVSLFTGLMTSLAISYLRRRDGKVPVPRLPILRNWLAND